MPHKDPEQRRAYGRAWMRRNPERAREAMRRWRATHRLEHRTAADEWDATHPESASARRNRYRQNHPEVRRVIWQLRRARLAGSPGKYTAQEWKDLVERSGGRCTYCDEVGILQPGSPNSPRSWRDESDRKHFARLWAMQSTQAHNDRDRIPISAGLKKESAAISGRQFAATITLELTRPAG